MGTKQKLVVIDVMPLLYRGHFAFMNKPRMTSDRINTSAIFVFTTLVRELIAEEGATHAALAMDTSPPTFRHERYPEYKAKREKLPEDIAASVPMAEEFASAMRIPFLRVKGFEADDLMGTLAEMGFSSGFETWLVTPDKDVAQLVRDGVWLCRPGKEWSGARHDLYDAARVCSEWGLKTPEQMVEYLGMAGDSTDNIPGFPGVGPKTASELISAYGTVENVIAHADDLKGKLSEKVRSGAEKAKLSKWLAKIRCDAPVNIKIDDLKIREPDEEKLLRFCRKYELSGLYSKITGGSMSAAACGAPDSTPDNADPAAAERQFGNVNTVPHKYELCDTREKLEHLASKLSAAGIFTFDTETTGLDPRKDRPVGFSFAVRPHEAFYVPVSVRAAEDSRGLFDRTDSGGIRAIPAEQSLFGPSKPAADNSGLPDAKKNSGLPLEIVREILGPVFADSNIRKTGHNIKFDLHVMRTAGIEVAGPLSDSMLAHYVLDSSARHGMDPLAREYLNYDPIPITAIIGKRGPNQLTMDKADVDKVCEYASEDADVSLQLHSKLTAAVKAAGAERAYEDCENKLIRILFEMESEGVRIDTEALRIFGVELDREISHIEQAIYEKAGCRFNIASPVRLAEVLYDKLGLEPAIVKKTSGGRFSTGEDILKSIANAHPIVRDVLEYRACTKLKSTYADKLPRCVDPSTGRIHTSFNQALTETGRLSSDNPNLQNIPVRTPRGRRIREAFVARDSHHVLMSADYSQIELRMMAALSKDEAMAEAFMADDDIHAQTASRVYGVNRDSVTSEMRSRAKMVNFGIIYGISAFGLAQRLEISRSSAAELIRSYFDMYPGVKDYIDRTIAAARVDGYVTTITGRRRPVRDINSKNATVRAAAERIAVNTPVQGGAADLIKLAMSAVYDEILAKGLSSKMILQVHDELIFDVPKNEVETLREIVDSCMTGVMRLPVPLRVDIGVGDNWLQAH